MYFVEGSDILSVPIDGASTPIALYSGGGSMTVTTDGMSVYWTDTSGSYVSKVPVAGGAVTVLSSSGSSARGLAVDNTSVYWVNSTDVMKVTPK